MNIDIFKAVRSNDVEKAEEYIKSGKNLNVKNYFGRTSLHLACQYGHYDIINLLLKNGADINIRNAYGAIPLHYACFRGYYDISHLLLFFSKGEDIKSISFNSFWRIL